MTLSLNIESPDLKAQVMKFLQVDRIVDRRVKPAMQKSVALSHTGWRNVAAVDTGHYRNTLQSNIQSMAGGRIIQGSVKTFAVSPTGFPYPFALENSTRYHYRRTSKRGQQTAGQITRMFKRITPSINQHFFTAQILITNDLAVK
jgi:hypothetical protein